MHQPTAADLPKDITTEHVGRCLCDTDTGLPRELTYERLIAVDGERRVDRTIYRVTRTGE